MTSVIDMVRDAVRQLRNTAGEVVPVDDSDPGRRVSALAATGRLTVAPGQTIASAWGNTTYDQTTQVFDSAAMRDNQWPAPKDGAVCYTIAEKTMWRRLSGAWVEVLYSPNVECTLVASAIPTGSETGWGITAVKTDPTGTLTIGAAAVTTNRDGLYVVNMFANTSSPNLMGSIRASGVTAMRASANPDFGTVGLSATVPARAGATFAPYLWASKAGAIATSVDTRFAVARLGQPSVY